MTGRRGIGRLSVVVIVIVALVLTVGACYWTGLISSVKAGGPLITPADQLKLQFIYSVITPELGWTITMQFRNTGSISPTSVALFNSSINKLAINSTSYGAATWVPGQITTDMSLSGTEIACNSSATVHFWVPKGFSNLSPGETVIVKVRFYSRMTLEVGVRLADTIVENVEVRKASSYKSSAGWTVLLMLENTGSGLYNVNSVSVGGVALEQANYGKGGFVTGKISTNLASSGTNVSSGWVTTISVWVSNTYSNTLIPGTTVSISVHGASGELVQPVELI